MRLSTLLGSFFFGSLICQCAVAGVVFEVETRDFGYSPPINEMSTLYADGVSLKLETNRVPSSASEAMIFRGDRREMVVVDHARQSYLVIDRQFAANMLGQLQQAAGQMQGMLDSLPADQRARVGQFANSAQAPGQLPARPKLQLRNTGQRQQIYGYPCVLMAVTRQGRKVRDVWVTNWNNIRGSRELAATFDSMSDFTQELLDAFPMQGQSPLRENAFMTIRQLGGFPVATREYDQNGSVASETALRSATLQSINPTFFQPPVGYQADSMIGGPQLGRPSGRTSANFGQYGQGRRQ